MPRITRTRFLFDRWSDKAALHTWFDEAWGCDAETHVAYWSAYRSVLYDIFASFARDTNDCVHHTHHRKILYYKNNEGFVKHLIIRVAVDKDGRAIISGGDNGEKEPIEAGKETEAEVEERRRNEEAEANASIG